MSRSRYGTRTGPSIPPTLRTELGLQPSQSTSKRLVLPSRALARKEIRKAGRKQRGTLKKEVAINKPRTSGRTSTADISTPRRAQLSDRRVPERQSRRALPSDPPPPPLKALTRNTDTETSLKRCGSRDSSAEVETPSRSPSPALRLDATSQAYKSRVVEEDANIAALERRLGKKVKKTDDKKLHDLDDLLGDLGSDSSSSAGRHKRKPDNWEWLQRKKIRKISPDEDREQWSKISKLGAAGITSDSEEDVPLNEDDTTRDAPSPFGNRDTDRYSQQVRENPYVPPTTSSIGVLKYVPPSQRQSDTAGEDNQIRLRRQLQNSLNKLSESNLVSIILEAEKLYDVYPRHVITSTLSDLVIALFAEPASLSSSFAMVHAAFITGLCRILGTDVGAEVIAHTSKSIDSFYASASPSGSNGKQILNLISLLCHLYSFQLIGGTLIFDYIENFLRSINELNSELILKIIQESGSQLRTDDPSMLKRVVLILQQRNADYISDGQVMNTRTKFMIETITDLRNNRYKAAASNRTGSIERIIQLRKLLGSLSSLRTLRAAEPLRIGLADIHNTDGRGSWWLVGASLKDKGLPQQDGMSTRSRRNVDAAVDEFPDLMELAKQTKMNTSIRRSIFTAVMSANDYQDAYHRIQKLRLKRAQENEISRVLLRCVIGEREYNPYYTLIVKKLCREKRMMVAFQFGLWSLFKEMGELPEQEMNIDGDVEKPLEVSSIVNAANMYGRLILDNAMSISAMKVLNLPYLKERGRLFAEVLIVAIFQQAETRQRPKRTIQSCFMRADEAPQMVSGLQHFLTKIVRRSDLITSADRPSFLHSYRAAMKALEVIAQESPNDE